MEVSIEGSSIGCSIDQSNWVAPVNLSYMVSYRDTRAHSDWLPGPFSICVNYIFSNLCNHEENARYSLAASLPIYQRNLIINIDGRYQEEAEADVFEDR